MSTTTNFKRIALVAVAALGLGVLSSVPSQATVNADLLTLSSATASQTTSETYTASAATVTASFFGATNDSISVTAALVSAPTGNTALPVLRLIETSSATIVPTLAAGAGVQANNASAIQAQASTVGTSAKYAVYLATSGGTTDAPAKAGTYVVKVTPATVGSSGALVAATAQTLTITVTESAALSKTPSTATSVVYIQGHGLDVVPATDSVVVASRTAGSKVGYVYYNSKNAAGNAVVESITAEISGPGTLGQGYSATSAGRSISVKNGDTVTVWSDGTSGVGTITIKGSTSGVLLGTKTATFYGTFASLAAPTIAATDSTVIAVNGTTKVSGMAKDASNVNVGNLTAGTDLWAISDSTSVATVATSFGTYSTTTGYNVVVTGVAAGTANIYFANASTLAAATIKSAPIAVRVGTVTAANVKVTTDKTSYAPGEKMTLTVSVVDSLGKAVVGGVNANVFATGGITASMGLGSGSATITGVDAVTDGLTNKTDYVLFAPVTGGSLKFSWTGGTGLATANQVAGSTTVTVTDSASAALAAVTALATTVASLRTLIVTLTNLVLKIQKKVKA
jgi:hypothetical protein